MKIASLSPELLNDPEHLLRNIRGGTRAIARYLKEVVLDPLPAEVFDFLVKTSFLNRLNAGLCNGLLGVMIVKRYWHGLSGTIFFVSPGRTRLLVSLPSSFAGNPANDIAAEQRYQPQAFT
jgi:hypothetical protein